MTKVVDKTRLRDVSLGKVATNLEFIAEAVPRRQITLGYRLGLREVASTLAPGLPSWTTRRDQATVPF